MGTAKKYDSSVYSIGLHKYNSIWLTCYSLVAVVLEVNLMQNMLAVRIRFKIICLSSMYSVDSDDEKNNLATVFQYSTPTLIVLKYIKIKNKQNQNHPNKNTHKQNNNNSNNHNNNKTHKKG